MCYSACIHPSLGTDARTGRVAAGAVAEKYLKTVHNIDIVAFVSSVGKIHLPSSVAPPSLVPSDDNEDNDESEDALSPEFVRLLKTITRDTVDQNEIRCPHPQTAERMAKVCILISVRPLVDISLICSESSVLRMLKIP